LRDPFESRVSLHTRDEGESLFRKAELEVIVKSQTTAFATFFGRKTLLPLGLRMSRTRRTGERGSRKALAYRRLRPSSTPGRVHRLPRSFLGEPLLASLVTAWKPLRAEAHGWRRHRPVNLGGPGLGRFLQKLEMHLPDKLFIDLNALFPQSVGDRLWRGV